MALSDRSSAAQAILAIPLYHELMNDLEREAIDACVEAKYDNHEARQAYAAEVRAIRNLRAKIAAISQEGQAKPVRKAPA